MNNNFARSCRWICAQCAYDHGAKPFPGAQHTWHFGECDVCKGKHSVTAPRSFDWRGVPK